MVGQEVFIRGQVEGTLRGRAGVRVDEMNVSKGGEEGGEEGREGGRCDCIGSR